MKDGEKLKTSRLVKLSFTENGWCALTIYSCTSADTGLYMVSFPLNDTILFVFYIFISLIGNIHYLPRVSFCDGNNLPNLGIFKHCDSLRIRRISMTRLIMIISIQRECSIRMTF